MTDEYIMYRTLLLKNVDLVDGTRVITLVFNGSLIKKPTFLGKDYWRIDVTFDMSFQFNIMLCRIISAKKDLTYVFSRFQIW